MNARTPKRSQPKVGADHVEIEVSETDFWELLPEVAAVVDDPTADYAIVPTYKLAREAAKDLKVVLTGEGGDEMFAGYGRYRSLLRPWWRGGRVMRPRGILDGRKVLRSDITGWRDGIVQAEADRNNRRSDPPASGTTGRWCRLAAQRSADQA